MIVCMQMNDRKFVYPWGFRQHHLFVIAVTNLLIILFGVQITDIGYIPKEDFIISFYLSFFLKPQCVYKTSQAWPRLLHGRAAN